jgi:hypothetical protein
MFSEISAHVAWPKIAIRSIFTTSDFRLYMHETGYIILFCELIASLVFTVLHSDGVPIVSIASGCRYNC